MAINNNTAAATEPDYIPTSEEMVIDTGDHDIFSSLDDLVVEDAQSQEKANINDDVVKEIEDATEEVKEYNEGDSFDFDDIIDDDLPEELRKKTDETEEDDEEEEVEEEESDEEDEEEEIEEEDEEYEEEGEYEEDVDYETYEVTLPNGENVTLQEAIEGYRTSEALQQEKKDFEVARDAFKEEAGNTISYLRLAKLEADRVIEDYDNFDWAELSRKDPQAYVENREFLDKYKARKGEILEAMEELESQEEATKNETFQANARQCLSTLQAEIPGWNDALYQDLMQYAIDNGSTEDYISTCVDPMVFKVIHKAMQFDVGKKVVKAKIRRKVGSPKKVAKSSAKSTRSPVSNKDKIASKLASGITGDPDVFNALED